MQRIPARPHAEHLKKQARQLLAATHAGDPGALARFRSSLPSVAGLPDAAIAARGLRLHDAQSCIAREYGFKSWAELTSFVAARNAHADLIADPARARLQWLQLVYAGDVVGGMNRAQPDAAARLLAENPGLAGDDPWLACAVGDEAALRRATAHDPAWLRQAGGPLRLPPLAAVTHSGLLRLDAFRERLQACARFLLQAGADVNQRFGSRWPPASLQSPSPTETLSALYGAAGQHHDPVLTQLLLDAGADPNDGESLYHALEHLGCARLLLAAGARIAGTHALGRVLDRDDLATLRLLLEHGADPNEPVADAHFAAWPSPLLWAIHRRRSPGHIAALLAAGADVTVRTADGTDAATLAARFGLTDVAQRLRPAGSSPTNDEAFIAACARADEAAARALLAAHPRLVAELTPVQLRMLSELAAQGCGDAVRCMVRLGWPIAAPGGDWEASALNQAVFRGDAALARFLLEHGASWTERHGFGDNCCGTLSWASYNTAEPGLDGPSAEGPTGDWLGCAQALVDHGMPTARPDPQDPASVLVNGQRARFSDEVQDFLLAAGLRAG